MADQGAAVVIKKVKKGGHGGGHHGGAWKVAYADFVTAMMAFFLLLWLLNVTTEEQKNGISNYFSPETVSKSTSGSGGLLGGMFVSRTGGMTSATGATGQNMPLAPPAQVDVEWEHDDGKFQSVGDGDGSNQRENPQRDMQTAQQQQQRQRQPNQPSAKERLQTALERDKQTTQDVQIEKLTERQAEKLLAERENKLFKDTENMLRQAIQDIPELKNLAENLVIDRTPEGLRIQIVDQEKVSMFPLGSTQPAPQTRALLGQVARIVARLPNKISVTGHTDALPYANPQGYSNWELSTDRANSSRRALVDAGVPTSKFERVVGKAERDPLITENAFDPRNRRISILILREAGEPPPEGQFPGSPNGPTRTGEGPAPAPARSTTTTPSAVPVTVTPPAQPRR
ncbi:MAG: chemotaxis protein MotB [Rhodospirillaceae bacterium]|nr:chemotaxis protein MotB [Rhodospirillaceae bacterium]